MTYFVYNGRNHERTLEQTKINDRFHMYMHDGIYRRISLAESYKIGAHRLIDVVAGEKNILVDREIGDGNHYHVLCETTGRVMGMSKSKPICLIGQDDDARKDREAHGVVFWRFDSMDSNECLAAVKITGTCLRDHFRANRSGIVIDDPDYPGCEIRLVQTNHFTEDIRRLAAKNPLTPELVKALHVFYQEVEGVEPHFLIAVTESSWCG